MPTSSHLAVLEPISLPDTLTQKLPALTPYNQLIHYSQPALILLTRLAQNRELSDHIEQKKTLDKVLKELKNRYAENIVETTLKILEATFETLSQKSMKHLLEPKFNYLATHMLSVSPLHLETLELLYICAKLIQSTQTEVLRADQWLEHAKYLDSLYQIIRQSRGNHHQTLLTQTTSPAPAKKRQRHPNKSILMTGCLACLFCGAITLAYYDMARRQAQILSQYVLALPQQWHA